MNPSWGKQVDQDPKPRKVCFVDRDGFYVGEEASIDYLLENPKAAFSPTDGDECDCGDCATHGEPFIKEELYSYPPFNNFLDRHMEEGQIEPMITAPDRFELWRVLRFLTKEYKRIHKEPLRSQILMCHMLCGRIYIYRAFDDIPAKSTECGCGREFVIYYDGQY
jgi:hypothetical protein